MREGKEYGQRKGGAKVRRAKRKVCGFCMDKAESIDYKDIKQTKKVRYRKR